MRIAFEPRSEILPPAAVVATGEAAHALAARLTHMTDERLAVLRGAAGIGVLAILGEADALPWADGAIYLGRDPATPRLFMPTMLRPNVAPDIFERAVAHRMAGQAAPWAVLTDPRRIFSLAAAGSIGRDSIQHWLEARI